MGRAGKQFNRKRRRRMMRVLRLDGSDEAKRAYLHIHAAMHAAEVRGIEQIRRVGKIIDKLEAVGVKEAGEERGPGGETRAITVWQLAGACALWLDAAEFTEIRGRMDATPWLPHATRFVARTFELLDAAPEEDPSKPNLVPEQSVEEPAQRVAAGG